MMSEMNGRIEDSRYVSSPALGLQIPSLHARTEGLPFVLQSPDNCPLVMRILQEMNQENVLCIRCMDSGLKTLSISEVKQESGEIEEQHFSSHSEFSQEWSLKGLEELLTEPEELHLRRLCSQQVHHVGLPHLQTCPSEDKSSIVLHSLLPDCNWNNIQQFDLQVDEKPSMPSKDIGSLKEESPSQANMLFQFDETPLSADIFSGLPSQIDVNVSQIHVGGRADLDTMQSIKMESEEGEENSPSFNEHSETYEEPADNMNFLPLSQSINTKPYIKIENDEFILSGQALKLNQIQLPELEFRMEQKTLLTMHSTQRNTRDVLKMADEFMEAKQNPSAEHQARTVPSVFSPMASEGSIHTSFSSEEGAVLAPDIRSNAFASLAEVSSCNSKISPDSPMTQGESPFFNVDSDKLARKPVSMEEVEDDQGQRIHLLEGHGICRQDQIAAASAKRQLIFAIDDLGIKNKNSPELFGESELCSSCLDAKDSQGTLFQSNTKQSTPGAWDNKTINNCFPTENSSGQTKQALPKSVHEEDSSENQPLQAPFLDDRQAAELPSPRTMQSLENDAAPQCKELQRRKKSSSEVVTQLSEPMSKRMRGTLVLNKIKDALTKEKDSRCHRSDGKHWRCVRECRNGAYYCQYHLRKRRIGYNRRRNNEVNQDIAAIRDKSSLSTKTPR